VVATHLSELLKQNAHSMLGHDDVQNLLNQLAKSSPKLAESLVPDTLSLSVVLKVMQNLLAEGIPIRDVRTIAENLAEHGARSQDPDALTAQVRIALNRTIYQHINGMADELEVATLAPELEQILLGVVQGSVSGGGLEPGLTDQMLHQISEYTQQQNTRGNTPVLLVSSTLRTWLSRLVRGANRGLNVLAFEEIPANKQIKVVGAIGKPAAGLTTA
jgi:flagellar biosynthesis protein FlhA